ncbi:hypothetical protein BJX61DRAFT_17789 [Aspergillus egyptiacus]|nr:hypothetical protein BJX61DRAFT_17789 [Aspergillus egyptiacus]
MMSLTFVDTDSHKDPFRKLPVELIHQIVSHSGDFEDIFNLLSASPWVYAIFKAQPCPFTLDLMAANPITQIPAIQKLCQNIALIRCPSTHCTSLNDYKQACEAMSSLPETADQLFRLIHIAAQIQHLTYICLRTMRRNFVSVLGDLPAGSLSGQYRKQNAKTPFKWIEYYRVSWVLWHLQHFSDLRTAAEQRWNWSAESLSELDAYLVWHGVRREHAEQIWTVSAVLADLGIQPSYRTPELDEPYRFGNLPEELLDQPDQEPRCPIWLYPAKAPLPYFASLKLPRAHRHQDKPLQHHQCCPPPVPVEGTLGGYGASWVQFPQDGAIQSRQVLQLRGFGFSHFGRPPSNSTPNFRATGDSLQT